MKTCHLFFVILFIYSCSFEEQIAPSDYGPGQEKEFVDSLNTGFYKTFGRDFQKARKQMMEAIVLSKANNWVQQEAIAQKNLAIAQYMLGEYEPALEAIQRSSELFNSLQDSEGEARALNEMGNFLRKQGRDEDALNVWKRAEVLAQKTDAQEILGTTYGMLGTYYWLQKEFEKSDDYYLRCYQIRMNEKDSVGLGYVLVDLADIAQRKGNRKQALDHLKQSNAIREAIGDYQGIVDNHKMMGDLYMKERMFAQAIPFYKKSALESRELNYPDLARKSYDSLSSAHAMLGEYQQAYRFQKIADHLEDSLFNSERTRAFSELQTKYETAQKEKEILAQRAELDRKEISLQLNQALSAGLSGTIILLIIVGFLLKNRMQLKQKALLEIEKARIREAQIEAAINSQETERKRFARDLHDGFGQMISVLNLNLKALEKGESDREQVFENSSKVLDEMYKELKGICFNLMPETLIKQGVIEALREFGSRVNKTGKLFVEIDAFGMEERLPDLQEISLYRISQEWVNNILKYSDADKVTISLTKDEEEVTLLIEDTGIGFDKMVLIKGSGNGWKNMNSRANLIKGALELDTTPGIKGSTLIVNAPVSRIKKSPEAAVEIP